MALPTLLILMTSCWLLQCCSALEMQAPPMPGSSSNNLGPSQSSDITCKKRGVGYGFHNTAQLRALSGISWWYDWGKGKREEIVNMSQTLGIEYVPMQWGGWGNKSLNLANLAPHSRHLLGFNEPNHRLQAALTPEKAAHLWPYLETIAREAGLLLGAPAAAHCGAHCVESDPFRWWDQFFALCQGCHFDFLATHHYGCNPDRLAGYLKEAREYGLPIWLTEFACPNGDGAPERPLEYMPAALDVLDGDPWVEAYAWYSVDTSRSAWLGPSNSLLNLETNQLTPLGELYLNHVAPFCAASRLPAASSNSSSTDQHARLSAGQAPVQIASGDGSLVSQCGGEPSQPSCLEAIPAHKVAVLPENAAWTANHFLVLNWVTLILPCLLLACI